MAHSASPRFELSINDKKVCTAGLESIGVLSAVLDWVRRLPEDVPEHITNAPDFDMKEWIGGTCAVKLGGRDSAKHEYLDWCDLEVGVGDEIRIRILPSGEFEAPKKRRDESTLMIECRDVERDRQ